MTTRSGLGYKPSDPEMSENDDPASNEETREQVGGAWQIAIMQSLLQQQQAFFLEQQEAQQKIMENLMDRQRGDDGLLKGARGAYKKVGGDLSEPEVPKTYASQASTRRWHWKLH